ncbi:MAG TPA: DUF1553 domain-containing protein [Chthoniobacteraceae bacterium]|jgi:hypothetical protein|nr:DUF1553 domain-containing protein [Chthoniobacteraceae bacterium]
MKPSLLLFAALLAAAPARAEEPLRFNRDIRPILSDKCFFCHGPDKNKRDSGMRLDIREDAMAEHDGFRALVPGDVAKSEIAVRITSTDKDEVMPPPKSKLPPLTPAEAATIKRWIAEGAPYEKHWSFIPVPPSAEPNFDGFIERGLAERGLKPQPPADRSTLIRRVSFDLTGLPPTAAEAEAFAKDDAPDAYEKLVDRLLASPRYGERMAVDWLDVARYADSYGYQVDRQRDVWPWRDWVIRAYNENLPYNQFITWQLAGDLLPKATDDQILATAFNRLHQQETEGGSVEEEYRVEYIADRVQTFSTAFLGLTFECTRCHDHKFDPLLQKEYYQLSSFFQNIDEAGLYSFFTPSPPTPAMPLMDEAAKAKRAELALTVLNEERQSARVFEEKKQELAAWLVADPAATRPTGVVVLPPGVEVVTDPSRQWPRRVDFTGEMASYAFDELGPKNTLANGVDPAKPATLRGENKLVPGQNGQAVQFSGDDGLTIPYGNFERSQPFSVSLWIKTPDVKERAVIFSRSKAWTDAASRGYELLLEEGKLKWSLIHFWPGNAASIRAQATLPVGDWVQVTVTSDGSSRAAGLRLYVNGVPAATEVIKDSLTREITGGGSDDIVLAERMRDRGFKGGAIDAVRVFNRELTPLEALAAHDPAAAGEVLAKGPKAWSKEERELALGYQLRGSAEWLKQLKALEAARSALAKFDEGVKEIMVMRELPQPKQAFVLTRGDYTKRAAEVVAGTPAALNPWPEGAPKNRLGLAQWLTDPQNPLTARVLVNRFWLNIFGRGLVKTAEDFGSQGARPLYPEVLDWLAGRFVQSGWDTKALLKTIVMSRTYRQRSVADARTMTDDPDNEWLARGPRFRLSAEMIRDNALAAAGLLKETVGGAPVSPYEMSEAFKPQGVTDAYRRSLYTTWRRTSPPPAMVAFDAPRRAVCMARRERTDSPLQALVLLNGTQYVEAARVLGEKLYTEHQGDVAAMIGDGFLRCLSRPPDAREREITEQLYREQLAYFQAHPQEAAALLKAGKSKPPAATPELAASAILGQVLLNHDACVVKR